MTFDEDLERIIADREAERLRAAIWCGVLCLLAAAIGALLSRGC